jgi:hypothetical protein
MYYNLKVEKIFFYKEPRSSLSWCNYILMFFYVFSKRILKFEMNLINVECPKGLIKQCNKYFSLFNELLK